MPRYRVEHLTRYAYSVAVSQSWQLARLTPRELPWQQLCLHRLEIDPAPDERRDVSDAFGNRVTHFGLYGRHRRLSVRMACELEVGARPAPAGRADPPWELVRDSVCRGGGRFGQGGAALEAALMCEPTRLLPLSDAALAYASASFEPGRGWFDAVCDLMGRIHDDFEFEPGATTVSTSVDEVLHQKRGVCQDFAHLMLAGLRGHGLAARYVSGYLLTDPPPGQPRLMGVDASHAWVAAYAPSHGWVEFDPTNRQLADARYITLAWGADFADVVPLRGVILGSGTQEMDVAVSVLPAG